MIPGTFRGSTFVLGSSAPAGSGFFHIVGYSLVLVGLPELLLLRAIREQAFFWAVLGAIVVFVGSFVWVHPVARGHNALRSTRTE